MFDGVSEKNKGVGIQSQQNPMGTYLFVPQASLMNDKVSIAKMPHKRGSNER